MSWRDAPLYVRVHDLCRDLLVRVESGPSAPHSVLRERIACDALGLLTSVSCALAFPEGRASQQALADEHTNNLKVLLRLARDLGVLPERGFRHVSTELVEIGRMIGGWRRRRPGPPTPTPKPEEAGFPSREAHVPRRLLEE